MSRTHGVVELWKVLGDIPINDEEEIEEDFLHFEAGTFREDIWHWFEETFDMSIGDIQLRIIEDRHNQYTPWRELRISETEYYKRLFIEVSHDNSLKDIAINTVKNDLLTASYAFLCGNSQTAEEIVNNILQYIGGTDED